MSRKYRDPFDLFDELFREIEEEFERFEREFMRLGSEEGAKVYGPYVYGFRITVGPDGKPKIEEFGNVRNFKGKPIVSEEREPLVDVIEKNDEVRVIAEVPGVNKDQIKVKISGNKLIIQAQGEDRKYYKEVELPTEVDDKSAKATYNNGVLQVILKKKQHQEAGTEIKVE
ncbi:archaeal heat shock protein Hsp20 [Sulfurisphaera tokodaii]|uniref:Small heat shock protein StHsp19.7 n=2 Tax=Sulfurisphaera tokodaii TaxID=111955 RepID=Q974V6_SULTO|nr:archaeal heat shock protein Hsp20 [Sulfurisphaera tokodaii]BAB65551.1 small heat shock protein StHsp19.7 [Sulfurisphaera tokodaii str. 7]HII74748.1 Hsp20/alpha crystallin family protein [Sulfurisphaera tokodaii]